MAADPKAPATEDPEQADGKKLPRVRRWLRDAHPFFWLVLISLAPAALVAATIEPRDPTWALRSEVVYRLEVGMAVFLVGYLVALALANGYKGNSIGRLGLPGGTGIDPKNPGLDEASEGAAEFQEDARQNFKDLADAIATMNGRVSALEDRKLGERLVRLEDQQLHERVSEVERATGSSTVENPDERERGVH
jgi:hypothetical protein